jgi:class 3 adenylate cyclase
MVNLNNRTDYFGTIVNIAAKLVGMTKEKDIVIYKSILNALH